MKQVTLHGEPIKVGDRIRNLNYAGNWDTIPCINPNLNYPTHTAINEVCTEYGKYDNRDKYPSTFWKEQTFDLSKPLPNLKVEDEVDVWSNCKIVENEHE